TTKDDLKASYSNFGSWVDVAAPGGTNLGIASLDIYSTYYPSKYAVIAGTSMASPFTAGLAALVAAQNPSFTPGQLAAQVRVTCDNIDALNSDYPYALGKGRINAYRALTDISSPSLRMDTLVISDSAGGNNNGILEANETFTVTTRFTNYLRPTSSAAI